MNENDYKYVMQDVSSTQLGARFSYEDLLAEDRVPFKFQSIIKIYFLREILPTITIAEHFLHMDTKSLTYDIYKQLKVKIRFYEAKDKGGFIAKQMKAEEFVSYVQKNWKEENMIYEISFSNLALMAFSV